MSWWRSASNREEHGVAIVELALVITLFLSLLWGIISFGYAYMLKENLTHATQEAIRAAQNLPPGSTTATAGSCPYYNSAPGTTRFSGTAPTDPRAYEAGCTAYNTIIKTQLNSTQGASGIDVTPVIGPCSTEPLATCLSVTVTFHNDASNAHNPVPPALLGISAFLPSTISSTATGKV